MNVAQTKSFSRIKDQSLCLARRLKTKEVIFLLFLFAGYKVNVGLI